ncbi:MAG TPA: hypothetical protein VK920_10375 [Solirubrobacterales bacterium]|nr:hypothetical protein [Solirubrobacterales bacterium]
MEAHRDEALLKVCPHCSVATRTDAEVCPNCHGPYARGRRMPRLQWSWWFAIPIVAAAFLVGYFGISRLVDGDDADGGVITLEEAQAIAPNLTRAEVEERLGEPAQEIAPEGPETTCVFYSVRDQGDTLWQFCFKREQQVSSSPVPG